MMVIYAGLFRQEWPCIAFAYYHTTVSRAVKSNIIDFEPQFDSSYYKYGL